MTPSPLPANDNRPPLPVAGRIVEGELVEMNDTAEAGDGRS